MVRKIDAQDKLGRTALHVACQHGHMVFASHLLKEGADADRVTLEFDRRRRRVLNWTLGVEKTNELVGPPKMVSNRALYLSLEYQATRATGGCTAAREFAQYAAEWERFLLLPRAPEGSANEEDSEEERENKKRAYELGYSPIEAPSTGRRRLISRNSTRNPMPPFFVSNPRRGGYYGGDYMYGGGPGMRPIYAGFAGLAI